MIHKEVTIKKNCDTLTNNIFFDKWYLFNILLGFSNISIIYVGASEHD